MDLLVGLVAFLGLCLLTLAMFMASLLGRRVARLILVAYTLYGILVGLLTVLWLRSGGESYLPNLPGQILGEWAYDWAIAAIGDPTSSQARYTIPWILRVPQVIVPASVLVWGLTGLIVWGVLAYSASSVGRPDPLRQEPRPRKNG